MKIVRESLSLFEFERYEENPLKSIRIGLSSKPMKERSKEFNSEDRKKAIEYLEATGLVKVASISAAQEKHLTLKLQLVTPYWRKIYNSQNQRDEKVPGVMYYYIQNGYLRKYPPGADRTQVLYRDYHSTYLDLAKILVDKAKYDMEKSESIRLSKLPNYL